MMEDSKSKLEKEMHNLALLKETVSKSSQLTNGMCSILTSFEERLMKLEQTILPVYNETGNLQRRQDNLEKSLDALDYVIQFYNVSKEVEPIIRDGPSGVLPAYLESMEKIKTAIDFFEKNNPNSAEVVTLTTLYEQGGDELQAEFRNILTRHSKPVPAITILDLVGMDDETSHEDEKPPLKQLPDQVIKQLTQIGNWLQSNKNQDRSDYMTVYASVRSQMLTKSLQGLRDNQKSSSGSSTNLHPIHSSPLLGGRRSSSRDTPSRKVSKRIQQAFMRKASAAFMKYSPGVETTGFGQRLHTALSLAPESKDDILDQEIEAYLTSVTAVSKLMQSELCMMQSVIPKAQHVAVFDRIIQSAVDNAISEGEALATRVKKCVSRHDYYPALSLFPILRHLNAMKPEFEAITREPGSSVRIKFSTLVTHLQNTINKALEEFLENVKTDPDNKVPKDGTVHELTSNVMMFLEQLHFNLDLLGSVLTVKDQSVVRGSSDYNILAFAQYINRVLSSLGLTLQNKSESYSDQFLKAIFALNNLHYILKSLQRTGLLERIHLHYPEIEEHYNDQIRDQKRLYSQSWSRVLHYVLEVDKPFSQQRVSSVMNASASLKLKDKDRQNIKDKFAGFNKEIEDVSKTQKAYAIPDIELREALKRDNKEYILPKYQMFYEKYYNMPFTKNPEKYLKYSPLQVANLIDKFFDAAA